MIIEFRVRCFGIMAYLFVCLLLLWSGCRGFVMMGLLKALYMCMYM
jgi:hypothetical protein